MTDKMKVMIVEDEEITRKGILAKIDWEALELDLADEAEDAESALDILESRKVDLIITDICLPRMDGFELIRDVVGQGKQAKFIVISGHDKFEYARTAMKYKVTEYLLKPIKEADLNESLRKMKQELLDQRSLDSRMRDAAHLTDQQRQQWRDEWLGRLLGAHSPGPGDLEHFREHIGWRGSDHAVVSVMSLAPLAEGRPGLPEDLLYFGLRNIYREVAAEEKTETLLFRHPQVPGEYVFLSGGSEAHLKTRLYSLFYAYIEAIKQYLRMQATIGVGTACQGLGQIGRSYADASFAVRERILRGAGSVIDYGSLSRPQQPARLPQIDRELLLCLEERKKTQALACVRAMFERMEAERHRLNHLDVQEMIIRAYMLVKKHAEDNWPGQEGERTLTDDVPRLLTSWQSLDEAERWFSRLIERYFDRTAHAADRTGKDIVDIVRKYIDTHFHQDIGLQFISETYHIHPIYFSRIFKEHVGRSFNGYLTGKRMERARELLRDTSLRLQEIAEIVGYEDPKYFSKVYKKYYGASPSLRGETLERERDR
ncbi:hypothetical protein B1A99_08740 [Cohnella sp. CIP 111063]|uniref:response regulator n=1 Tax=unclassified Cohnella TaxID=2636738 RepID=UPI000B8C27B9|nr:MULTISPECIES: response regulator [unclassified Cohnella]OXS60498.1 hypothetical protein B1A99_08740 [Cohnella sp. CIP 111063]PRX73205.1 two-component system response regulator YesN [Cohnella sp. SGD-V74]